MKRDFDIAFEGGGARAVVHLGAMRAFEARGLVNRRVIGTSSGAIGACLLAAGYDSRGAEQVFFREDEHGRVQFTRFLELSTDVGDGDLEDSALYRLLEAVDVPLLPDALERRMDRRLAEIVLELPGLHLLYSFFAHGGMYSSDGAVAVLREALGRSPRGDFADATLAELYAGTGHHFTALAADCTSHRLLALNHVTTPDLPVVEAVRMSMSIPFVFSEVIWRAEWGQYNGFDVAGHTVVDGGALSNFPLGLLTSENPVTRMLMGDLPDDRSRVIGFLIDTHRPLDAPLPEHFDQRWAQDPQRPPKPDDDDLFTTPMAVRRVIQLVETMMAAHDRLFVDSHRHSVVNLPAKGFTVTDFGMNAQRRSALIAAGERTMTAYLDWRLRET